MSFNTRRHDCVTPAMQIRVATAILFAIVILTSVGWTEPAWGEARLPRVGILSIASATDAPTRVLDLFRRSLAELDWIEGKNVTFVYRDARSEPARFTEATEELVRHKIDVIWAASAPALRAAYATTRTIPIVALDLTTDPVAEGYVQNYARPGGNVTGVFLDAPEFAGKWFELLTAMIPDLSRVSVLWDPGPGATHLQAVRNVAQSLGITLQVLEVRKPEDIDAAFDTLRGRPQAVIFLPSPMIFNQSAQLARLALKHGLPATSMAHGFANAGGAVAYGPELTSMVRRNAVLVDKVLDGKNPAEIPLERPTKIHLVVNLKTAKALDVKIPQSILLRADEVIR
jgi:putative ABC transport system substrate-binding protein